MVAAKEQRTMFVREKFTLQVQPEDVDGEEKSAQHTWQKKSVKVKIQYLLEGEHQFEGGVHGVFGQEGKGLQQVDDGAEEQGDNIHHQRCADGHHQHECHHAGRDSGKGASSAVIFAPVTFKPCVTLLQAALRAPIG